MGTGFAREGIDLSSLIASAGLDPGLFADSDAVVPLDAYRAFWLAAERHLRDPLLGLRIGAAESQVESAATGYAVRAAPSLYDLFVNHLTFQRAVFHADVFRVLEESDRVSLELDPASGYCINRSAIEYMVTGSFCFLRAARPTPLVLLRVTFTHPGPRDLSEYVRVFACPVSFRETGNRIEFTKQSFQAERELFSRTGYADAISRAVGPKGGPSVGHVVEDAIRAGFLSEAVSLESVARAIGLTPRTLQRKLTREGATFQSILDAVRREVVTSAHRGGATTEEMARLAGFHNASALLRARRRWDASRRR